MVVLGVSFDSPAANKAFRDKCSLPFALLCDTDRSLGLAYGACDDASAGHPRRITVVIDGDGVVQRVYAKVDPKTHAAQVLEDLGG